MNTIPLFPLRLAPEDTSGTKKPKTDVCAVSCQGTQGRWPRKAVCGRWPTPHSWTPIKGPVPLTAISTAWTPPQPSQEEEGPCGAGSDFLKGP